MVYVTGSHAKHTLIQLCGYLIFLKMLISENKYPIIPIMVIDHISKPFSETNKSAIGTIINKACECIGIDNFQIFMFDDEPCEDLGISVNHKEDLFDENKSGFNPFLKLTDE